MGLFVFEKLSKMLPGVGAETMIIVFYTPTLSVGGYEKVVVNYANALAKMENSVIILCGKEGELRKNVSTKVTVINLNIRARGFLFALTRFLKQNRDIDILYVPFRMFTAAAVIAKAVSHSDVCIYGAQHGFEGKLPFILKILYRTIIINADVLTAVSKTVADSEALQLGIPAERYYVLNNPVLDSGLDFSKFQKYTTPTAVISGRLAKDKHCEIPIKIIRCVNQTSDIQMLVLGDGPELNSLKALVEEYHLQSRVKFLGYVSNPIQYMLGAKLYYITSEIESFGNGVVEAMYAGLPVVTTDCGGPVELIEKGKYGVCIGRFDSEDVVKRGTEATLDILLGRIEFADMRKKAMSYIADQLIEQFLRPYYEHFE